MQCPHCHNDDDSMIEEVVWNNKVVAYLCNVCGRTFVISKKGE